MLKGKVKHIEHSKGWGFVETEDGEDYFFSFSNIRAGQKLSLGDSVKFDFYQTSRGPSAQNISKF